MSEQKTETTVISGNTQLKTESWDWRKALKTGMQDFGMVIFHVAVTILIILYAVPYFFPPLEAGLRKTDRYVKSIVKERAKEINEDYFKRQDLYTYRNAQGKKRIDPNKAFQIGMAGADEVRDDRRRAFAQIARANDQDESFISTKVQVYQDDWATMREIRIPTRIQVVGQVRPEHYPEYTSGPDGINWTPTDPRDRDRTVLMEERNSDQQSAGEKLNQAIGRICEDPNGVHCHLGLPLGSDAVLCIGPGFYEGGYFQGWYDGLIRIGGVKMSLYFSGAEKSSGSFKFIITPDDPAKGQNFATKVCQEHPAALVVRKPTLRAPDTLLVSK